MNARLVATTLLLLLVCVAAGRAATVVESGLQAYYRFNGNTADESSSALALTLSGAALATDRFGAANKALSFSNNTSTASFNYSVANQSFSIAGWWYQPTYSALEAGGFAQGDVGSAGLALRLMTDYAPTDLRFAFWGNELDVDFTWNRANWIHIVATLDNSNLSRKLYIDGALVASDTASYGFSGTGAMRFGFMTGSMDEIRVYDRAITGAEVATIYSTEVAAIPEPGAYCAVFGALVFGVVWVRRPRPSLLATA